MLRSQLMKHQRAAVDRGLTRPRAFAYLAETGTGKSLMVLAEYVQRLQSGDICDLLVIAPAGSITNWYTDKGDGQPSELRKHLAPELLERLLVATNRDKAADRDARKRLLSAPPGTPRALFVNVESFSRDGVKSKAAELCADFMKPGKTMLVLDESTTCRNHKASRTATVMKLGRMARSRRILTGLVSPRSPLDLFAQYNFLDETIIGYKSFTLFRARYAKVVYECRAPDAIVDMRLRQIMNRRHLHMSTAGMTRDQKVRLTYQMGGFVDDTIPKIEGYQNLTELSAKIAPHSFQILKRDCLDLPPKVYLPRDVELTDEQRRVYREIRDNATAQLSSGSHVTATTVLSQITRLHQVVCGHVRDEEGVLHDVESNRVQAVLDVLEEHEGKAVIWVTYDRELRKIADAIEREFGSVARFWGGNVGERVEDERRFLSDPSCRHMVSTPASGGRGNTWVVADLAIYAASSYDLEHRFQSEDRIHRIGQTRGATYVDLIARGTVEEKIIHALRHKINLSQVITGENWREWVV